MPTGTVGAGSFAEGGVMQVVGDSLVPRFADEEDIQIQQILPDGRTALSLRKSTGAITGPVVAFDLRSGESRMVLDRPFLEARYTMGYLVTLALDGTLQAIPFDGKAHQASGAPVTIGTSVSVTGNGFGQLAVARNGTVVYIPEEPRSLMFLDRSGSTRPAAAARHSFHAPMFSPDGRRISTDFTSADGRDVWILALDQGTLTRATFARDGHDATWTPDGRSITYAASRNNILGIYRTRPGNATPAESLFASAKLFYPGLWLPDGSGLVTVAVGMNTGSGNDLALLSNGGRGPMSPLVASQYGESYPSISPDGKWLAFVSDQSGQQEVYVRPLRVEGEQVQVSQASGSEPLWSRDGRELFYRSVGAEESRLIVAAVRTAPEFEVLSRQSLFSMAEIVGTNPHTNYDVSPDGRTFVMVQRSPATRIMVIQNLPGLVQRIQGAAGPTP